MKNNVQNKTCQAGCHCAQHNADNGYVPKLFLPGQIETEVVDDEQASQCYKVHTHKSIRHTYRKIVNVLVDDEGLQCVPKHRPAGKASRCFSVKERLCCQ